MRPTAFGLVLGCAVAACSSDTTPTIYVDLAYQLRCLDCDEHAGDSPVHKIKVVDGEDDFSLDCVIRQATEGRKLKFTAMNLDVKNSANNRSFSVDSAGIGDVSQDGCSVRVVEGNNTYVGTCSSDEPSSDAPCQVSFTLQDKIIKGSVYCANIPADGNQTSTRYLVAPNTASDPATFSLYGCPGL
jgi:hypothetical protein